MKVILASVGNIDFGQDHRRSLPGIRRRTVKVKDFAEASDRCRDYIREHGLGGGNWAGGSIIADNGEVIGQVSYNGRVWPPGEWQPDMKPLWEPSR